MAYLFWTIALVLFSSLEVVSKPIMNLVNPYMMTFMRFFIGGLFLFIISFFMKKSKSKKMDKKDFLIVILIGCLNCIISMTLLQLSVKVGNASSAAVLISTNPIFTAIFATIIIKENINQRKKIGITIGLAGILIFGFGMIEFGVVEGDTISSIIFGLSSAVTFALYSVLMKKYMGKYGVLKCTAYSSFFPSIIYGTIIFISGNFKIDTLGTKEWLIIVYLGIFVTGIAYYALLEAVNRLGASTGMRLFYVKPVLATILALIFLNEPISFIKLLGMGIIIFSLFL